MGTFEQHFNTHIAPKEQSANAENSPEKLLEKIENEKKAHAQEFARQGSYDEIVTKLQEEGLLLDQMNRIQKEYGNILDSADFLFKEDSLEIWKALTVLELFDKETFKHSLQTYQIAKGKIESQIEIDGQTIDLKEMIESEGLVDLNQFYKACLLHDIGKVEVPHFLISSNIKNSEWAELMMDFDEKNKQSKSHDDNSKTLLKTVLDDANLEIPVEIENRPENTPLQKEEKKSLLINFLTENDVQCVKLVPISQALNNPLLGIRAYTNQNMAELEGRGYSRNSPLLEIMKSHEKKSKSILQSLGLKSEADLVGAHHDYENSYFTSYDQNPITISSFTLSKRISELLRIADMHEAIHARRPYADERSQIQSLIVLARSIYKKKIHPMIANIWLSDELQKIKVSGNYDQEKISELDEIISSFK